MHCTPSLSQQLLQEQLILLEMKINSREYRPEELLMKGAAVPSYKRRYLTRSKHATLAFQDHESPFAFPHLQI